MATTETRRMSTAFGGRRWSDGFNRLAAAQSCAAAADALVAVSLADSLFFSISPDASREQVLIYLLVNMVPFTLLAPCVGPLVDKFPGAHRVLATLLYWTRAALVVGLALALFNLAFYFFALALVIAGKAMGITKQSLVPALVDEESDLVAANARLARLSLIVGAAAGGGGAVLAATTLPEATLIAAGALFVAAGLVATRLPDVARPLDGDEAAEAEIAAAHKPLLAESAWAFAVIRGAVGFFAFGIAFALRRESEPAYMYGVAGAAWAVGTFGGSVIAPALRRRVTEDRLIAGSLISLAVVAAFAALGPSRPLVVLVAAVLGLAATLSRQAFDALVQARVAQGRRGRAVAGFETRFQLGWVAGAIAATAVGFPIQLSMAVVAAAMIPAGLFYLRRVDRLRHAVTHDVGGALAALQRRTESLGDVVALAAGEPIAHPEVVAIDLAAAVDVAHATGFPLPAPLVGRATRLRQLALDGAAIDQGELLDVIAALADEVTAIHAPDAAPATTPEPVRVEPARPATSS